MQESRELVAQNVSTAVVDNMSISQMKNQVQLIQKAMSEVMQDKQHYGVVPGCGDKKVLLKPGAEKLSLLFRLAPHFEEKYGGALTVTDLPGGHKTFEVHCAIVHIPTGDVFAIGVGICSTMETKYRYRKGNPICPYCGKESIYKSKKGDGYFCWKQKSGCGATFTNDDEQITSQKTGRCEHDNPADYYNTCIKIGKKRAYVDGIVSATACGDIFTQDLDRRDEEDTTDEYGDDTALPPRRTESTQQPTQPAAQRPLPANAISDPQRKRMFAISKAANMQQNEVDALLLRYGFASSHDVTKDKYQQICNEMENGKTALPSQRTAPQNNEQEENHF